jgi:hypothetical protein
MTKSSETSYPDRRCTLCGSALCSLPGHDAGNWSNARDIASRYQYYVLSPPKASSIARPELPVGAPFSEDR